MKNRKKVNKKKKNFKLAFFIYYSIIICGLLISTKIVISEKNRKLWVKKLT